MADSKNTREEFARFMGAEPVRPPAELSERVFGAVAAGLAPSPLLVFARLLALQAVVGAVTLLLCPQFGVSFGVSLAIFDWLHEVSFELCMAVCGAFFVGCNAIVASLVLSWDEVRSFGGARLLSFFGLSGLSLVALHFLSPNGLHEPAIAPWGLGAALGGGGLFWAARRLRVSWVRS